MVICFRPGHLGTKPDALTRHPDLYLKEGGKDFGKVNPLNFKPIFSNILDGLRTPLGLSELIKGFMFLHLVISISMFYGLTMIIQFPVILALTRLWH